jgi:Ser/Thr protein kinase RdoA (MazF antagonist)
MSRRWDDVSDRLKAALRRLPFLHSAPHAGGDPQRRIVKESEVDLDEALGRWGARGSAVTPLSRANNLVYRFERGDRPSVLRLIRSDKRSADMIEAELDWLRHLQAHGVPVAIPVASQSGQLVESVAGRDGATWNAVVFPFIDGRPPDLVASGVLDGRRISRAGELLGRIHELGGSFVPRDGRMRFRWPEVDLPALAAEHVPEAYRPLVERIGETWQWLSTLPRTAEAGFGLIHGDFWAKNLLEVGDRIHVIDFDAACYGWKQLDLAHMMAMTLRRFSEQPVEARAQRAQEMFRALVQGYSVEHRLEEEWVGDLPRFMHFMDLLFCLYACAVVNTRSEPGPSIAQMPYFAATYATAKDGHEAMRLDLLPAYRRALSGS